jgi:hypothetical protein
MACQSAIPCGDGKEEKGKLGEEGGKKAICLFSTVENGSRTRRKDYKHATQDD